MDYESFWLVGGPKAENDNNWEYICQSYKEALRCSDNVDGAIIKEVKVNESRNR